MIKCFDQRSDRESHTVTLFPADLRTMGPKAEALMKGPVGRFLVVAEVATLVGAGVIYYQVGDGHRTHRASAAALPGE